MKLVVLTLACCTVASAHPGAERVKRQSSASGASSGTYSSGGGGGNNGFAFSGAGALPFGDLFAPFPGGFDQGARNGSDDGRTNTSSKRDTADNSLATDLLPPHSASASSPSSAYGHPAPTTSYGHPPVHPFLKPATPFIPSPGLLTVFAQTIHMLGQLVVNIIQAAAGKVSNAAHTFPATLNAQLSTIGSSAPVGIHPPRVAYGVAASDNVERNFNQSDIPAGLSPPDGTLPPDGSFGNILPSPSSNVFGFVPGPAPPGTSGFIPASVTGYNGNMTLVSTLNATLGRFSAGLDALLNAVDARRLFSRSGLSTFNAFPFPQMRSFGYSSGNDYNGIGAYNGYYNGGFNGGTNGLGGFGSSAGYRHDYNNNYYQPGYARYAPSYYYDRTSSFANSPAADVGLFSRISPVAPVYGGGPGVSSSYSSSVTNGNGGGITFTESNVDGYRSGSTTQVDPSGRVTSYQHGSGAPDTVSTRMLGPGQASGIYSASGVTNNNGNVSTYRAGGATN